MCNLTVHEVAFYCLLFCRSSSLFVLVAGAAAFDGLLHFFYFGVYFVGQGFVSGFAVDVGIGFDGTCQLLKGCLLGCPLRAGKAGDEFSFFFGAVYIQAIEGLVGLVEFVDPQCKTCFLQVSCIGRSTQFGHNRT